MKKFFTLIAAAAMTMAALADDQVVASWIAGETVGTWTALGTATWTKEDGSNYTSKYNANATTTACMTFSNSYSKADDNTPTNCIRVDGDFKKGDVITFQPFTAMSNADFTGGSKYANIEIRDVNSTKLFNTDGTAEAKTVTDGHEEAGDPKEFTYTLASDLSAIYFGRSGNTRINVMKIVITRGEGGSDEGGSGEGGSGEGGSESSGDVTTWTFNSLEAGVLTDAVTYQTLVDNLMFTGGATTAFNVIALDEAASGTFSDGSAWSATKYVNLPSNTSNWANAFSSLRQAGADGDASNNTFRRAIAYNATKKGTMYVAFGAASDDETAKFEIYTSYNDGSANTYATANAPYAAGPVEVKLSSTTDNATFWIRGSKNGTRVYAVRFVPDGSTTAIDTVQRGTTVGDGCWYTLSGQAVSTPTKGIYVRNGKKVIIK